MWLGKALPREWLDTDADAVEVDNVPTRYGRVGLRFKAAHTAAGYQVAASVRLPVGYAPPGGVRVRVRAPLHARAIVAVAVGGTPWTAFDAAAETIDFAALTLTPALLRRMESIVVRFG